MIAKALYSKLPLLIAGIIIAIWVAPYFLLGQDAHIRVHDNLDSNLGWYKVLKESGQLFALGDKPIEQIMNGEQTRDAYYSQFNGMVMLFSLFPPMVAYGLSQLITRTVAFLGMYILSKKYIIREEKQEVLIVGVSLLFALTPYWPSGMLSILGMPIALWAFLNIRNGNFSWKNYLILTVLPFLSSFVLGFFYFLTVIGLLWIIDVVRKKKWNLRFLFSIIYMIAIYVAIDYRLVLSMLVPHEITNRDVFYQSKNNLISTMYLIKKNYIYGHNQDNSLHAEIILPLSLLILAIVIVTKQWKNHNLFISIHLAHLLLSTWYAFWFYEGWQPLKERVNILTTFNFSRFHYFSPVLVYLLFMLSLTMIWKMGKWGRGFVLVLLLAQLYVLIPYNEQIRYENQPSYREFFAEEQFAEIKEYIGLPVEEYRVVSIGIHPVIAQFNGFFYTGFIQQSLPSFLQTRVS